MFQTSTIGLTLMTLSIVPLLFLIYTLTHLDKLGIELKHPRIIVELLILVGMLVIGFLFWVG